jgi:polyferredoxin
MKATKFRFRRITTCGHSAALMLTMLLLIVAATPTTAQTNVFVPGTASGNFGSGGGAQKLSPLVSALTVSGPGTVTVTYVSGQVWWGGGSTGPNGAKWSQGAKEPISSYPFKKLVVFQQRA